MDKILIKEKILLPNAILTPENKEVTNFLQYTLFYSYFYKQYIVTVEYYVPCGEQGGTVSVVETQYYFIGEVGRKTKKRDNNAVKIAGLLLSAVFKNINTQQAASILDGIVKVPEITASHKVTALLKKAAASDKPFRYQQQKGVIL